MTVRRLLWCVGLALWAAVFAALVSFDPADAPGHGVAPLNPAVTNWMGPAGAWVAYQTVSMIGSGVWILLMSAGAYLAAVAFRGTITHVAVRAIGVIMVALAFSGFHTLFVPWLSVFPEGGGGLVAIVGVHELAARFGSLGAALWLALMGVVGLTVAFDDWFNAGARTIVRPFVVIGGALASATAMMMKTLARPSVKRVPEPRRSRVPAKAAAPVTIAEPTTVKPVDEEEVEEVEASADAEVEQETEVEAAADEVETEEEEVEAEGEAPEPEDDSSESDEEEAEAEDLDESEVEASAGDESEDEDEQREFTPEELRAKIAKLPVRFAGAERRAVTQDEMDAMRSERSNEEVHKNYVFPGLDLLVEPEDGYEKALEAYVRDQAQALESALHTYNIKGEVAGIESGPVITLYQVRLAPGTKVSAITAVASDIARALKSVNIRVVPNTEGLDTVGVEVPNRKKEKVRLKELMTRTDALSKMKLPMFLGKDASGRPLTIDLASLPHMLIAGTTGSGKSVCMNAIIMGFLYTQKPADLKLVLVDPKVVELSQFKDIPHLMCPVVTDMSKAAAILEWAVGKMDERYELLAEAGCRDITSYNALSWEELKERMNVQSEAEEAGIPRRLPYMVFIIDELADLMMTNKEVEGSIVRIAQKARAVGIHLILATQRPQANVVTGLIKSNMPGRLCFKVASGMDSRIVLDQKGGELLLGQGDMLFITPRASTPMRAQGTLVDDSEIRNCVRFVRDVSSQSFERQLVQLRGSGGGDEGIPEPGSAEHEQRMLENAQEDPLFDRAVEIVLETKRGSVSLLQRRLAIGYTRASRLIELMGMAGIIGGHKGSVAREVTMTLDEWQAMKKQAELDAKSHEASGGAKPAAAGGASSQPKLFPEPVTAKEVIESRKAHGDDLPASMKAMTGSDLAGAVLASAATVEEPPFDVDDEAAELEIEAEEADEIAEAEDAAEVEDDVEIEDVDGTEEVDELEEAEETDEVEDSADVEEDEEDVEAEDVVEEDNAEVEDEVEEDEEVTEEDAAEVEEEEEAEAEDAAETEEVVEDEEAESEAEAEVEADAESDEEYEYEYVEVDDVSELEGEDYEIVGEVEEGEEPDAKKSEKK